MPMRFRRALAGARSLSRALGRTFRRSSSKKPRIMRKSFGPGQADVHKVTIERSSL
jgi:hypothetical protein